MGDTTIITVYSPEKTARHIKYTDHYHRHCNFDGDEFFLVIGTGNKT